MKTEIDRIKSDVEIMRKAMGLPPSLGREWFKWMKRDRWVGIWWAVPGLILILEAVAPIDRTVRYLGLVADQWTGLLVAATLLAPASVQIRRVSAKDGRLEGMIREVKRVNGMTRQGMWAGAAQVLQMALYFAWGRHYHIPFAAFWPGLYVLMGTTLLVVAFISEIWLMLGYAIPFTLYGLCLPLVETHHKVNGLLLGLMFVAIALSFSPIQILQIRQVERQNESH